MKAKAKAKAKKTPKKQRRPAAIVEGALQALAAVDRKDAAATARALADVFVTLAEHLGSDAIDEPRRKTLERRIRAARRKILARRPKKRATAPEPSGPAVAATRIVMVGSTSNRITERPRPITEAPPPVSEAPPPISEAPPALATTPTAPTAPGWLPKTLHVAGVVEGHEPTAVVLGLLREALASATTSARAESQAEGAGTRVPRPLPTVLADLFGAFGLSRSPSSAGADDASKSSDG